MPKILRILNRLNVGGPTYNVAYLSKYIDPVYITRVLAGHKEPDEASSEYILQDLGVDYQLVPDMYRSLSPIKDRRSYSFIKKVINEFEPDIVHTHAAKAGALGRLAAANTKKKPAIVHTYHGNVFDGYFSPLKTKMVLAVERYLCTLSTAIIAISDTQKKDLAEKYRIAPPEKIHVIKLGFDLSKFTENRLAKRTAFRNHYHLDDNTVVITITGRLAPVKNHSFFISALALAIRQNTGPKIKAFVVGDGELLSNTLHEAENHGLSCCPPGEENFDADIIFTSWRKDIDVINAGSDIIALTSVNEGTPVSIIEALASKKAVICTDVGGVRDVIQDGSTGIIASLDVADYASKLGRLIGDGQLRHALSENGESTVLEKYSYRRLVSDVEKLYSQLINK